jgi:hypothetical protein
MSSNLDTLAAADFARNPFLEPIVRRKRGEATKFETVYAVVEVDSVTAQSVAYAEGGLEQHSQKMQTTRGARIEVAADQETFPDDTWEYGDTVWATVGQPEGSDAGSKTIILRDTGRLRGRTPNVNTR